MVHFRSAFDAQVTLGRDSGGNESDDFWVAYIQVAYQFDSRGDGDNKRIKSISGLSNAGPDVADDFITPRSVPRGGQASMIFLETATDLDRNKEMLHREPCLTKWDTNSG
jgi:hypothetical protein